MLTSISPVGEAGRRQRWWLTVTAYLLGSAGAGALVGALAGAVGGVVTGPLPDAALLAGFAVLVVAGLAADTRIAGLRLPTWRRQVDERWLQRYRGWVYGVGFGAQLGLGVVTIVTTSAVYATLAAALLAGSVPAGALVGLVFGVVRALPLIAMWRVRDATALGRVHARLAAALPVADRLTRATLVAAASVTTIGAIA